MAKVNNKVAVTLGCLVLFVATFYTVDASDSPFGAPRPQSTTSTTTTTIATTTTTTTSTQAPTESTTLAPSLSRSNDTTLTHNSTGTEEHAHHHLEHNAEHQHDALLGNNNTLQSDTLTTSHGHSSDAPNLAVVSSTILLFGLSLGVFVI